MSGRTRYRVLPGYQSEQMKILNISFPQVEIGPKPLTVQQEGFKINFFIIITSKRTFVTIELLQSFL